MMADDERRNFYLRIASRYEDCATTDMGYEAHLRVPKRLVELHGKPGAKVLDLGCGTGLGSGGLCAMTIAKPTDAAEELGIRTFTLDEFLQFIDNEQFDVIESFEFYGWESGHLAKLDEHEGNPHHKVDYNAVFLRKRAD